MKKLVPRGKMSKKSRRALDGAKRVTWGFSPITRKLDSAKRYRRADQVARKGWEAQGNEKP